MEKNYQPLADSPLIAELLESGTGVIEGNFRANRDSNRSDSSEGENLHIYFSDFCGRYLGEYYIFCHHGSFSTYEGPPALICELLTDQDGSVYNQIESTDSIKIYLLVSGLSFYEKFTVGKFMADWGGPTVGINKSDLTI